MKYRFVMKSKTTALGFSAIDEHRGEFRSDPSARPARRADRSIGLSNRSVWFSVGVIALVSASIAAGPRAAVSTALAQTESKHPNAGPTEVDQKTSERRTILGVKGSRFTLDGKETFLLGFSYYGAAGAPEDFVRRDLDDLQRRGFNWLRVWATCNLFEQDITVVDSTGGPREHQLNKLKNIVADCDRRGLVVDVTLTRDKSNPGTGLPNLTAHLRAVRTVVTALKPYQNWFLDLANERDVGDDRYVPAVELKTLRDEVRRLDPQRLVTASFGGHDLGPQDVRDSLQTAGLDFLTPHRPRDRTSPAQTEAKTRETLALLMEMSRLAPILYQEPLRRGYIAWNPTSADLLTDLRGAKAGGAAGWCFHNGPERESRENRPRRSFDLRSQRLLDQLDAEELIVVRRASIEIGRNGDDDGRRRKPAPQVQTHRSE